MSVFDERTLRSLDFAAVRARLRAAAATERAKVRFDGLTPSAQPAVVRLEQQATAEMRALLETSSLAIPRAPELGESVARASRGASLDALELRALAHALAAAEAAVAIVRASPAPVLNARCAGVRSLRAIVGRIERAIDERGGVTDSASPALGRIRRDGARALDEARDRAQTIVRSSVNRMAIQDAIVTVRDGRFVIPLKAEAAGAIPGVVHDTSSSGQTLYVEPLATVEANNRVRRLRLEEEREVARVLAELSAAIGAQGQAAELNLEALCDLDTVAARAIVAEKMEAVAPQLVDGAQLTIVGGRHPLLGERAVPQSLSLDAAIHLIVISGPNMGGKTVALKMCGLYVAMAYCGLQLPAREATVGTFSRVECALGDEQSIALSASTFSAHLERLKAIVDEVGEASLVLIDEIASGTEAAQGAALAIAILERLLARGAHTIVTTHATELKLFAQATAGVRNASVRFDARSHAPTFELDLGTPGPSFAFPLARARGLDEAIVARAESLLSSGERTYERALGELSEGRAQVAQMRSELLHEREHLSVLQDNARRRGDALERERRAIERSAEERLSKALREFTAELGRRQARSARVTPGRSALLEEVLDGVRADLGIEGARDEGARQSGRFERGDIVFAQTLGAEANVMEDYGDTVLVAAGPLKAVVKKPALRFVRKPSHSPAPQRGSGMTLDTESRAKTELDVRGMRVAEAEPLVERWLDDAQIAGLQNVRLIHGKGTGLLGQGLQRFVHGLHGVGNVRYGNADEGGGGVSVIELSGA